MMSVSGNVHYLSSAKRFRAIAQVALVAMTVASAFIGRVAQAQSGVFSSSSFIGAASSSGTNQDYNAAAGRESANQRGDIFWVNNNFSGNPDELIEVPVGTTTQTILISNLGPNFSSVSVDPSGNLWVQDGIDNVIYLPYVNGTYATGVNACTGTTSGCSALPNCSTPVSGTSACLYPSYYINPAALGYYVQLSDIQADGSGNVYGVDYYDGGGQSYGQMNRIIKYTNATGAYTIVLDNLPWANANGRLAVTPSGNIYYADATNLYYSAAGSGTATTISGFSSPNGVTSDSGGNIYVTDQGNNRIFFLPANSGTNISSGYSIYNAVSSDGTAFYSVGVDGFGNVIFGGYGYGGAFFKLNVGDVPLATPTSFLGKGSSSGSTTVNLIFSSSVTFGSFAVKAQSGTFSTSGSTCTSGAYTAGQTCSINVTYTGTAAGQQTGILQALSNTGTVLAEARLSGYCYANLLSVDTGTMTAIGSSWSSPTSIAVDGPAGNTFVADSGTGNIYKNGSTVVASGFSSPSAVAVDASGNLYVADTGNGRIQEVPYTGNSYGSAVTIYSGVSGPSGLAIDTTGSLYVADSGNSRVLLLAAGGNGYLGSDPSVIGSGFTTPVSVAVTQIPNSSYSNTITNIYVSDSGTNKVSQIQLQTGSQTVVASGFTAVAGITVDQGSSLYIADSGTSTLYYLPNYYGNFGAQTTAPAVKAVTTPYALAMDALGNMYQVDKAHANVVFDNRTAGFSEYGSRPDGTTGDTHYFTLNNSGNDNIFINSNYVSQAGATADFSYADGNCSGYTLYEASNCYFDATFTPVAPGGSVTDVLTFSSNAPSYTMTLHGTGTYTGVLTSLTVSGFPTPTSIGLQGTITVSAFDQYGAAMTSFTGTVTITSNDSGATLPASYTFQASDNGVAEFNVTLNDTGTYSITATSGSVSGSQTGIVVGDYVWVLNATGTTSQLSEGGSSVTSGGTSGTSSTKGGLAFDAGGNVWSVTSGSNALIFTTKRGASEASYSGGGLSTPVGVAIDGAGYIWVANSGNNSVSSFSNAGAAQSGSTGYGGSGTAALSGPSAVIVDGTGGVWVTNKAGNSVAHIVGVATPVVTPLSTAVANGTVGTKP